jgi:hypothetical protein
MAGVSILRNEAEHIGTFLAPNQKPARPPP